MARWDRRAFPAGWACIAAAGGDQVGRYRPQGGPCTQCSMLPCALRHSYQEVDWFLVVGRVVSRSLDANEGRPMQSTHARPDVEAMDQTPLKSICFSYFPSLRGVDELLPETHHSKWSHTSFISLAASSVSILAFFLANSLLILGSKSWELVLPPPRHL